MYSNSDGLTLVWKRALLPWMRRGRRCPAAHTGWSSKVHVDKYDFTEALKTSHIDDWGCVKWMIKGETPSTLLYVAEHLS